MPVFGYFGNGTLLQASSSTFSCGPVHYFTSYSSQLFARLRYALRASASHHTLNRERIVPASETPGSYFVCVSVLCRSELAFDGAYTKNYDQNLVDTGRQLGTLLMGSISEGVKGLNSF